ncbi:MAG: 16S rRNA (guanine(966)-N(2))-methyltransferase RsmD [Clostridia bacterium]|nr:16S rRNA (guanine(966)-N(2))-methyltransferase RsmD [Clostridia bacterium]
MRIIGGEFRGKTLYEFKGGEIRPTSDMTRESLFNIINKEIEGSVFLDLFCGTGAVGIEALSRGAKKVVFNDFSKESIELTKGNVSRVCAKNAEYSFSDAVNYLKTTNEKFDFIFVDPPYKSDLGEKVLEVAQRVLTENGVIIYENEKPFCDFPFNLYKSDERRYGRAILTFFRSSKINGENVNCVFAGSFDPITKGHEDIISKCKKAFNKVFVVLGDNPEKETLLTKEKRLEIVKKTFENDDRIQIELYSDLKENYSKFLQDNNVKFYVRGIRNETDYKYEKKYEKINSELYPFIKTIYVNSCEEYKDISSSKIRKKISLGKDISQYLPDNSLELIIKKLKEN